MTSLSVVYHGVVQNERKFPIWPFYLLALLAAVVGIPMLVTGLGAGPSAPLEMLAGRVTSLSWLAAAGPGGTLSLKVSLEGSRRVFVLERIDPAQRKTYERLVGHHVDLWIESPNSGANFVVAHRLETNIRAGGAGQSPIISYDHKGSEDAMASRVRWGAMLVAGAAILVVLGRLVDVWNRHRHEIMGS